MANPNQQQSQRPRPQGRPQGRPHPDQRPGGRPPQPEARPRPTRVKPRAARQFATIHRVDPWSVLKYSLIINFALLLVTMVGVALVWAGIQSLGWIDALTHLFVKFQLILAFNPVNIARAIFLVGLLLAIVSSAINLFIAFFYNLIADLIGGFRIELASDE